ncbi:MAG: N-acetylmuramoyl-L-alanine amidase [Clostridia bacterium]|nr:N-acetylmuramoyl-L-alanine amidase [Clostridia bacterium]
MQKAPILSIPLILSAFAAVLIVLSFALTGWNDVTVPAVGEGSAEERFTCVVIDAGHGGEDGGAISANGLYEKDVNLAVAFALRDLLEMNGISVVMTRDEDVLLYDRNVDYRGRKKVLDLAARKTVADNCENCLFVSIHMNAFPQTQYSGTQVWYGTQNPLSESIAADIQKNALLLQPNNHRKIKAAGSSIYLLDNIRTPCVLVECGFLSNPEEAARLSDENYQQALAFMIFSSLSSYLG